MGKIILSLAVLAALVIAFQNATADEDRREPRLQLVEVEQQTPYLESYNSITAGTATQSAIRRVGNTGGVVFSSQGYALFDNQNPDGSRATFPLTGRMSTPSPSGCSHSRELSSHTGFPA